MLNNCILSINFAHQLVSQTIVLLLEHVDSRLNETKLRIGLRVLLSACFFLRSWFSDLSDEIIAHVESFRVESIMLRNWLLIASINITDTCINVKIIGISRSHTILGWLYFWLLIFLHDAIDDSSSKIPVDTWFFLHDHHGLSLLVLTLSHIASSFLDIVHILHHVISDALVNTVIHVIWHIDIVNITGLILLLKILSLWDALCHLLIETLRDTWIDILIDDFMILLFPKSILPLKFIYFVLHHF